MTALTRQVSGIFAVAESYPDLKASANFVKLQEELTNTENKISYSRQLYNSVVSNYNVKLETSQAILSLECLDLKQQISFKLQKRKRQFLRLILAV